MHPNRSPLLTTRRVSCLFLLAGVLLVLSLALPAAAADVPPAASLIVNSEPSGARVFIQGTLMGLTPYATKLPPGVYTVRVVLPGYQDYARELKLVSSQVETLPVVLNKVLGNGALSVSSTPAGARVFLDGTLEGTSPVTREVTPGLHSVRIVHAGYVEFLTETTVADGKTTTVGAVLIPVSSTTGAVEITSSPAGAAVLVDGVIFGPTPITVNANAGTHAVRLTLAGYQEYLATVSVTAGETLPVSATLAPLPAKTTPTTISRTPSTTGPASAGGIGSLVFTSLPEGAKVYLDGTSVGFTPATVRTVTAGEHQVLFTLAGYRDSSYSVTVRAGEEHRVHGMLEMEGVGVSVTRQAMSGFSVLVALGALGVLTLFRSRH